MRTFTVHLSPPAGMQAGWLRLSIFIAVFVCVSAVFAQGSSAATADHLSARMMLASSGVAATDAHSGAPGAGCVEDGLALHADGADGLQAADQMDGDALTGDRALRAATHSLVQGSAPRVRTLTWLDTLLRPPAQVH